MSDIFRNASSTNEREEVLLKQIEFLEKLLGDDEKMRIIGVLSEALHFYADPETYFAIMMVGDSPCGPIIDDFSDDHGHPQLDGNRCGKTAREALKEAFGKESGY